MLTVVPEAPGLVLVNKSFIEHEGLYLIVQRSSGDGHDAGKWDLPGGKCEHGQILFENLRREVLEETGLIITPTGRYVHSETMIIRSGKYAGSPYVALFSIDTLSGGALQLSSEHSTFAWVSPIDILGYDLTERVRNAAEKFPLTK